MKTKLRKFAYLLAVALLPATAQAVPIVPAGAEVVGGGPGERGAWLISAISGSGRGGEGNGTAAVLEGLDAPFYGGDWTEEGSNTGNGTTGGNGWFTVNATSGSWGGSPVEGTWAIDPAFWLMYSDAAISLHVGNGQTTPDYFLWRITQDATSGTWFYDGNWNDDIFNGGSGNLADGQGLSNLKLYGRKGERTDLPDAGATLLLLGSALGFLGLVRRRSSK